MSNGELIPVQLKYFEGNSNDAANDPFFLQVSTLKSPRFSLSDMA
jgi:hypothetical protein